MKIVGSWVQRVRFWWTAGFTLLFLLNLDQFAYSAGLGPAPKYWSMAAFLITLLLFVPGFRPEQLLRKPVAWWALGYLLISVLWLGLADHVESAIAGLTKVITTCLFVGSALLAYPSVKAFSRSWAAMLWAALLLATFSIMQEYFNPTAYLFAEAGQGIPGRAAGLYLNPNTAAQTLVMILACLMAHGSARANAIALLISMVGIFLTFSRGGMVAWLVLAVAAAVRGRLHRGLLLAVLGCAAIVLLAGPQVLDELSVWVAPENRNSLNRLAWLLGQGDLGDSLSDERAFVAAFAWEQYLEAPVAGHGLGYMWVWSSDTGAHNQSLRFMVEYGVLGALIFPLFLLASMRSAAPGADRYWQWLVAGVAMLLSLFSHNLIEQAVFLMPWLAICLISPAGGTPTQSRMSP